MSRISYRELLWDFSYEGPLRKGGTKLRVFSTEQQMFETSGRSYPVFPVSLPTDGSTDPNQPRSAWTRSRVPQEFAADLGRRLWEAIPFEAKTPLLEATPDQPWRLKISSNSPRIDDLPWEWLNDGSARPAFALRPEIRLARSIPIRIAMPPMRVQPPLRVLLVITNPKDERLLNPWAEIEAIRPRLAGPPYQLRILEEPTWDALVSTLRDEPHIVHYIGHAGIDRGEGNLILHDWRNVSHWISGVDLSKVLPVSVRLLCLSTCYTTQNYQIFGLPRFAHTSALYRLPSLVTNQYPVGEQSVRVFWSNFYELLIQHGGNLNEAFHEAQQAVALVPDSWADWGSFSLVIRDQSGELMRVEQVAQESPAAFAEEVQAQFASRLANDLAARLRSFGDEAPKSIQESFQEEAEKASGLTQKLL